MTRRNGSGGRRGRVIRKRPIGRGVMYGRRSQSKAKQEHSFAYQVDVAIKRARELNVPLAVDAALIAQAERTGLAHIGDLYVDDGVSGSELSRPGLDKLIADLKADRSISHVFVHKRDRLARPHRTSDGAKLEEEIVELGVTIVFENDIIQPRRPGEDDTVEVVTRDIEYSRSGRFSYDLSDRVLKTAKVIAGEGYRLGGPAPYGFVRILVDASGKEVEELPPGKKVDQPGCRVRIKPNDWEKIRVWVWIIEQFERGLGTRAIANRLTEQGIPTPAAGSKRKRNGVDVPVSTAWHSETVMQLLRNPVIIGLQAYGRQSAGTHKRWSPDGPRDIDDRDVVIDSEGHQFLRLIYNEIGEYMTAPAGYEPLVEPERWHRIQEMLANRTNPQVRKPKSRSLEKYPLATRVYCLCEGCGALMYGHKQHGDLKYICSRYEESDGRECEHNTVSSERLFEFACRLVTHGLGGGAGDATMRDKLRDHATRVRNATPESHREEEADFWAAKVANLVGDAETAGRRMAIERDDAAYEVLKREYSRLNREAAHAKAELAKATSALSADDDLSIDEEVEAGMRLVRHLAAVLLDPDNREEAREIFRRLGIQIGLTFGAEKFGPKRFVRRLKGGVVVYGDAQLPRPVRSDSEVEDASRNRSLGLQTVDPFARALLAAVDPNARKEARKSLDRRQAVDTTSTASSGTPGGKTAGGLTKDKSFGRDNSSGRT
jgi:DNA invertase Pin-like site-specific DNA recombinase